MTKATDSHLAPLVAGFVAVLVGYTSSAAIVFQAAQAAGADPAQSSSWLWALGLGMGATSIGLALRYRMPILTAWSTPGAALLITGLSGLDLSEAVGVFLFSAALTVLFAVTGLFDRLMQYLPRPLAAAMLAGVLFPFALSTFDALAGAPGLVGAMLATYLIAKRLAPRYAVPWVFAVGVAVSLGQSGLHAAGWSLALSQPVWTSPSFAWSSLIGVGIPLFVVTMASQNLPGIATLHAANYRPPLSPLIGWTGVAGLLLAPFGGFAFNLAAITAAICQGPEAGPNPATRYRAAVWAGVFYLLTGVFGATVAALFAAFPRELVLAIAGLALLGTIGNALADALQPPDGREAALLCFVVTVSGLTLFGVGSAFWGLVVGAVAWRARRAAPR